jgi:hypothetical protein
VEIVLPIGRDGVRHCVATIDLDDMAEPDQEGPHTVDKAMQLAVEVENPVTRKRTKVGKLDVDVCIKFASAAPGWGDALLTGGAQMLAQLSRWSPSSYLKGKADALSFLRYTITLRRGEGLPAS